MAANMSNVSSSIDQPLVYFCSTSKARHSLTISIFMMKTVLVFPLSTIVLYLGLQRWRQQRSSKSVNHSDILTFHLAAMELFWGPGMICYLCGTFLNSFLIILIGSCAFSLVFYGEMFFHMLTCVDRYLAVVHPIVYVRLRSTQGVKIRNACITSAWLLSFGLSFLQTDTTGQETIISILCCLAVSIIVVTFCSLSVLCSLIRPGPGEGGGKIKHVDQLKQRAFHTITAISAVLWLWFLTLLVGSALTQSSLVAADIACIVLLSVCWVNLACGLLSPLLFLNRAGKLPLLCCNREQLHSNVYTFKV